MSQELVLLLDTLLDLEAESHALAGDNGALADAYCAWGRGLLILDEFGALGRSEAAQ